MVSVDKGRTAWQVGFADLIDRTKPAGMTLVREVHLMGDLRTDLMLLRREERNMSKESAFRRLWPVLPRLSLVDYRSRSERRDEGTFDHLWSDGHLTALSYRSELVQAEDLALILAVPSLSSALREELRRFHRPAELLGGGLYRVPNTMYPTWVLSLNEASDDARLPLLGFFGSKPSELLDPQSRTELTQRFVRDPAGVENLEGYSELVASL